MTMKLWPFPGDSPIVRARKMCLAYRHLAQQQHAHIVELTTMIAGLDERIVNWIPDSALAGAFREIGKSEPPQDSTIELDIRFNKWGETWHADVVTTYEPEDWVPVSEAAKIVLISTTGISRNRAAGRITGKFVRLEGENTGKWYYKVADLYDLQKEYRHRRSPKNNTTVTVETTGEGTANE